MTTVTVDTLHAFAEVSVESRRKGGGRGDMREDGSAGESSRVRDHDDERHK